MVQITHTFLPIFLKQIYFSPLNFCFANNFGRNYSHFFAHYMTFWAVVRPIFLGPNYSCFLNHCIEVNMFEPYKFSFFTIFSKYFRAKLLTFFWNHFFEAKYVWDKLLTLFKPFFWSEICFGQITHAFSTVFSKRNLNMFGPNYSRFLNNFLFIL